MKFSAKIDFLSLVCILHPDSLTKFAPHIPRKTEAYILPYSLVLKKPVNSEALT